MTKISHNPATRLQRAQGRGSIAFEQVHGQRRLRRLRQEGSIKLMLPGSDPHQSDVVFINTAGGITGGDRLQLQASLGPNTQLRIAGQTAERIYRRLDNYGEMLMAFKLGANTELDYLPQETIFYNGGALRRRLWVEMAPSASFLTSEIIVLGRQAMGESVSSGCLHDQWAIYQKQRLLFADSLKFDDFSAAEATSDFHASGYNRLSFAEALKSASASVFDKTASLAGHNIIGTLLYLGAGSNELRPRVKQILDERELVAGVSAWNGLLLVRCLADQLAAIKQAFMDISVFIRKRPMPKVWLL